MSIERRAVIDVGTNSVKLLVAEVEGARVVAIEECHEQTRLGRGFYVKHHLLPEAIEHTAQVVARFAQLAAQHGAQSTRIIATSAARDALNQAELRTTIQNRTGLILDVISGEKEAELAFRGVATDPHLRERRLLVFDVGGGSTQASLTTASGRLLRHSFRMGAVRLLEHFSPGDPPSIEQREACQAWIQEYLVSHIRPFLSEALDDGSLDQAQMVGTGGTSSVLVTMHLKLEAFDRARIEATALSYDQVRRQLESLWSLTLADRKKIPGLPPNRADVILTGVAIYEGIMRNLGLPNLRVSTRGLRFAAVMD